MDTLNGAEARKYIRRIRNQAKKAYAEAVYARILRGEPFDEPRPNGLSYMAAQAVRMELAKIRRTN